MSEHFKNKGKNLDFHIRDIKEENNISFSSTGESFSIEDIQEIFRFLDTKEIFIGLGLDNRNDEIYISKYTEGEEQEEKEKKINEYE